MSTDMVTGTRQQQAQARLLVIRNAFEVADEELERAFVERDWEQLEFDSWESYCAAMPGYRHFKMKAGPRRERARKLREAGATIPEIVAATGSSLGTIHRDLNPAPSFQMETAQPVQELVTAPPALVSGYRAAAALVAAQGERGLTVKELAAETGWHHGQSSGALSKAAKRKLIKAVPTFRDGCAAYVVDYGMMSS